MLLAQVLSGGIGLLTTTIAARSLGPDQFGAASVIIAYPSVIFAFLSVKASAIILPGLVTAGARHDSGEFLNIVKAGFLLDSAVAFAGLLLVACLAAIVTIPTATPEAWSLAVLYAASIVPYSLLGTSCTVFAASKRLEVVAAVQLVDKLTTLVAVLMMLGLFGAHAESLVFALAAAQVISGVAAAAYAARYVAIRSGRTWWSFPRTHILDQVNAIRYRLGWSFLNTTASGLAAQVPILLAARIGTGADAAFLRLGMTMSGAMSQIESGIGTALYPALASRHDREGLPGVRSWIRRWSMLPGASLALVGLVVTAILPRSLTLLLGAKYAPMATGLYWMLAAATASLFFIWLIYFYYATGDVKGWAIRYTVYASGMIAALWLWRPSPGFTQTAIIMAVARLAFLAWTAGSATRRMMVAPANS